MVKFGSVFRVGENCYAYLGQTEDIIYAARILDNIQTKELTRLSENRAKTPDHRANQGTIFCFVILSTNELREQAAYLHNTEKNTEFTIHPYMELCKEDIDELKNKILDDEGIPSKLKAIVQEIFS